MNEHAVQLMVHAHYMYYTVVKSRYIPPPTPTSGPVKVLIILGATALTVLGVTLVLQYMRTRRQPEDTSRVAQETNPRAPSEMVVGTSWGPRGQGTLMAYI